MLFRIRELKRQIKSFLVFSDQNKCKGRENCKERDHCSTTGARDVVKLKETVNIEES